MLATIAISPDRRMSPNSVFSEAFAVVKDHHEVTARLGTPVTGYGADHNSHREGRRNFVTNDQVCRDHWRICVT